MKRFYLLVLLHICTSIAFGQNGNSVACFKIENYEIFGNSNGEMVLTYSSALMGNLLIEKKGSTYSFLKGNKVGLKIIDSHSKKPYFFIDGFNEGCHNFEEVQETVDDLFLKDKLILTFKCEGIAVRLTLLRQTDENAIYTSISAGTAFFIDSQHIVTNYHVIQDGHLIKLFVNGQQYLCKVVKFDMIHDLAILKVYGYKNESFAHFSMNNEFVGNDCYSFGFPYSTIIGNDIKFTSGIISSQNGFKGDSTCFQITAPIDPGNSGGPLADGYGNIIGVTSAKLSLGTNIGYAIKSKYVYSLWPSIMTATSNVKLTAPVIYRNSSKYTFLIKSYQI